MFTVLNAALLVRRIRVEERALATVARRVAAVR
jgi:isoprenylcysteine carboxyl methyltransferase (ICMT) family protein YpbQ